jgi:hypothetical protein
MGRALCKAIGGVKKGFRMILGVQRSLMAQLAEVLEICDREVIGGHRFTYPAGSIKY